MDAVSFVLFLYPASVLLLHVRQEHVEYECMKRSTNICPDDTITLITNCSTSQANILPHNSTIPHKKQRNEETEENMNSN